MCYLSQLLPGYNFSFFLIIKQNVFTRKIAFHFEGIIWGLLFTEFINQEIDKDFVHNTF